MLLSSLLILGLASATVSVTVGSSKLFKPWREALANKSQLLGELVSCPYCLGHYSSAFLVGAALRPDSALDWFITGQCWLAVTAISALVSGTIVRLFND